MAAAIDVRFMWSSSAVPDRRKTDAFDWTGEFGLGAKSIAGPFGCYDNYRRGRHPSLGRVPGKFRENRIQIVVDLRFTFGQVQFDPRMGELRPDGSVVKLTPRAAAVLCALAQRAQQLSPNRSCSTASGGWRRGRRRRVDVLYPGAAWRARRRRPPPALHRDPSPARLPADGASRLGRASKRPEAGRDLESVLPPDLLELPPDSTLFVIAIVLLCTGIILFPKP
jgi:hypothetical protein